MLLKICILTTNLKLKKQCIEVFQKFSPGIKSFVLSRSFIDEWNHWISACSPTNALNPLITIIRLSSHETDRTVVGACINAVEKLLRDVRVQELVQKDEVLHS